MPYFKRYSTPISSCPDPLTGSGELDKGLRNGLNASVDNKSVSGFLKFADRKVKTFPHFISLSSRLVTLPTHGSSSDHKLKTQKLADGACPLLSCISFLGGHVSQARVAHLVWLHDDIHRGFLFLLFAFVASCLFFYCCFFSSSSCTATHERRKKQNQKVATTLNTCEMPAMDNHKGYNDGHRAIHSLSTSKLRSKSNSNLKSKSSSTDLKKKKILNDDSKLSKSNNELMRNQRQKMKTKRKTKIKTERRSSGRGRSRSRRSRGSTQRRQRGRYYLVQQSSRKLRIQRNHKKKKRYKKNKKKEKILKLISFHHYKMKQEIFDSMNGDIMSHLCLLIMVIFLVSTFCL